MRNVAGVFCLLGLVAAYSMPGRGDSPKPAGAEHDRIVKETEAIISTIVDLRRELQRHPEASGKELRTSALVEKHLSGLSLQVKAKVGGYGVLGVLQGANPGPVLAWRADMDALIESPAHGPGESQAVSAPRHSCGHDVHTAIGLGIAGVLGAMRRDLSGTIMFLFQPAEEDFTGAKAMIEDGVFAKLKPEAVFALHVVPFPAGILATKPGAMFACRARLIIQLKEVGEEKEALGVVAGLLQELNTPPGVNVSSLSPAEAGQGISRPESVLGNYFTLAGAPRIERQATGGCTVRVQAVASSIDNLDTAVRRLERSIGDSKLKESVTSVSFELMQPVVNNDPNLAQESAEIVRATAGESAFVPLYGVTPGFNDDFAFFLKEARGVYFFLGGSNPEKGIVSMPHTSDFAVEEACIGAGVARISSLLFELARRWPEVKAETEQKMRLK